MLYVARDKNSSLHLFSSKPFKNGPYWISKVSDVIICLSTDLYPEVKWEDEEPTELVLKR